MIYYIIVLCFDSIVSYNTSVQNDISAVIKRRQQNQKISFHFLSGSPHTPAEKGLARKFLVLLGNQREREARRVCTRSARTIWFRATTRSARAKLIKILRILLIQCSNFVQKTPPILTFARMDEGRRVTKRHAMPFLRYAPRFFQRHDERAVAHEVVRLSKAQSKIEVL